MKKITPLNRLFLFILLVSTLSACKKDVNEFSADNKDIRYSGRIDLTNAKEPILVGSASFAELSFTGDSCQILLRKLNPVGEHNYVVIELDGRYLGRFKLAKEETEHITVAAPSKSETHNLRIFKATEAQNGQVAFIGVNCKGLNTLPDAPGRKIEFIGNSITCGMGVDLQPIPCDSGVWYDQHNAYLAYGPIVARQLNAQFMLSSVSGIGIYRNWNSPGPVMPEVYEKLYLNKDSAQLWDSKKYTPDLVSICLGTNDFSDGDGVNERLPFDSAQFITKYIGFVKTVYSKYPDTQICLLTSPMVSGEKGELFYNCLTAVQQYFKENTPERKAIFVFNFKSIVPHGCGYHPDNEDQRQMADVLTPFYKEIMGW